MSAVGSCCKPVVWNDLLHLSTPNTCAVSHSCTSAMQSKYIYRTLSVDTVMHTANWIPLFGTIAHPHRSLLKYIIDSVYGFLVHGIALRVIGSHTPPMGIRDFIICTIFSNRTIPQPISNAECNRLRYVCATNKSCVANSHPDLNRARVCSATLVRFSRTP